jgi:tRNA dimethylallyltransferase
VSGAPPLLVIAGATATGKTGLAIEVAGRLRADGIPAEIISADSRQVYRGLDIGTAKVPVSERADIPHHGLDLIEPDESFSVADFVRHARTALDGIAGRGGLAILAGGTGLYLRAIARGLDADALPADPATRAAIEAEIAADGLPAVAARLAAVAPVLAAGIDRNNPRRVARTLEIATLRGDGPLPEAVGYPGPVAWVGLGLDPVTHLGWISARARAQFDAGLMVEAAGLRERFDPDLSAFSAIGYREAWAVIDGRLSLEQAIAEDARRNVAFVKRQRTWFKAEPAIEWLDAASAPVLSALAFARRLLDQSRAR